MLVTGASRGIGWSIAENLHSEGCRVALNSRNVMELNARATELKGSIGFPGDVTDPTVARQIVSDVIRSFGRLDILVCNVGDGRSVSPGKESLEEWQRVFALNLWSATNCVEAACGALSISKGTVVCISSICGMEVIEGAPVTYSTAKAALHAYIRGISRPLGKKGIRINAIAPGNVLFSGSVWEYKLAKERQSVNDLIEREVALGCFIYPNDVANLVSYLASSRSGPVTGSIWKLDGGQSRA